MTNAVTIPASVIYKKVGDEAVLLQIERGIYYGLDAVGTRIWELLAEGKSQEEARDAIVEEYDVDADTADRDIAALIGELLLHGLVERTP
jgi:hypothetical protein